jgi:multidrug efflux pump subunit AcrA (membrane-fusion protein)
VQLARAEARAADAERAAQVAEQRAAAAERARDELAAALAAAEDALGRAEADRDRALVAPPPGTETLRSLCERRGLLGEDEVGAVLRAFLDAHRVGELARLRLAEPDRVEELLWERVLLLAEGEEAPVGVVAVRVPPDRSEGRQASANRSAMSRFSTACLVHNVKRVVVVGGSPAYHRTLREGVDPRIDLRLVPGNRRGSVPQVPGADLVIIWASTILDHSVAGLYPDGVVIPHRGVARMLTAATEWIESGSD